MTYDQLIGRVLARARSFLKDTSEYASRPVVYDSINEAIRNMARESKDIQATATLAIVSGTAGYTVSSAIGTDVGDILLIAGSDWEALPATVDTWNQEYQKAVDPESDAVAPADPRLYKIWNGTLTLFPTPTTSESVTVYYTKKIAQDAYTTTIGSASIPVGDEYITALIYKTVAYLAEGAGNDQKAVFYHGMFRGEFDSVLQDRSFNDNTGSITYHDATG